MRQNQRPIVASVVACLAVLSVLLGAQADPAIGTWKLNLAKSKYVPGPVPKSNTITIAAVSSGYHVTAKGEDAAGKATGIDYTVAFDGKDVPVKGAPAAYDTTSLKRIDANTSEQTRKKDGKMVQTVTRKVSADGKTMTVTTRGKDEAGRTLNTVAVYDRQ